MTSSATKARDLYNVITKIIG